MDSTSSCVARVIIHSLGLQTLVLALGLLLTLCVPAQLHGVEFGTPKSYVVGTSPSGMVSGDFNGDGKLDLAVGNAGSGNVSVLLGNGDGTFQAAINSPAGTQPSNLAVGDFNSDGTLDLIVVKQGDTANQVAGSVQLLLGKGDGSFQAAVAIQADRFPYRIAVGDVNGDHKLDLIVGDQSSESLTVCLGRGDGTFSSPQTIGLGGGGGTVTSLLVSDFNGDGKPDVLAAIPTGPVLLLGKGDGTFQSPTPIATDGLLSGQLLAGDFDGDGNLDFAFQGTTPRSSGCNEICITLPVLHLYRGNGDGTFKAALSRIQFAFGWAAADFNQDGKLDLLLGSSNSETLLLGQQNGSFQSLPSALTVTSGGMVAADFNSDGLPDVAVTDATNNVVAIALNVSPTSGADVAVVAPSVSPEPVGAGANLTYKATVVNEGPKDATGVTFTDTLAKGMTFVSATSAQGTCSEVGETVTCDVGDLASAFASSITIVATPSASGTITNSMAVSANEADLATTNNSAMQMSTVVPVYTLTTSIIGDQSGQIGGSPSGIDGLGINCPGACTARYLAGTVVDLAYYQSGNTLFSSWGGACTGPSGCEITMDSDKSVTASFATGVTLTVNLAGDGRGEVSSGGIVCTTGNCVLGPVLPGSAFTLLASPFVGSSFVGWSGACSDTDPNPCAITLNASSSITATFNLPPDFSVSPTQESLSLTAGAQITDVLSFGAQGGFSGTISLSCSVNGPTPMATCAIAPSSVTAGGNATLTITAPASVASASPLSERNLMALALVIPGFLVMGVGNIGLSKRRRYRLPFAGLIGLTIAMIACGGGQSSPSGSKDYVYTVSVIATSGATHHTTAITVTVR